MGKKYLQQYKIGFLAFVFSAILLSAQAAIAVDILEIRVKRLYKEAEELTKKGDYDEALKAYNKAISYAKDKDIKQFLMNAKKELQKKRRQKPVAAEVPPAEKSVSGITPSEMKKKEAAPPAEESMPEEKMTSEEQARLKEERAKLEAERKKLEEERASLEAAKIRSEQAEREARLAEEQKTKEEEEAAALEKEEEDKGATPIKEISLESEADAADLEQRKEREAKDRAIYENNTYRYRVKQILDNAYNKFKETAVKIETDERLKRIESKLNKLTALDNQAEEFMVEGQYEKAQDLYKKILDMSKDPDLKEYIKGR
ncbi:MAG: hypothetical protein Q8R48_01725 [Candidatus Omnitrophota bacterium]|nr:hypothetical protein [Candidatus Omnitrophota bacterium]